MAKLKFCRRRGAEQRRAAPWKAGSSPSPPPPRLHPALLMVLPEEARRRLSIARKAERCKAKQSGAGRAGRLAPRQQLTLPAADAAEALGAPASFPALRRPAWPRAPWPPRGEGALGGALMAVPLPVAWPQPGAREPPPQSPLRPALARGLQGGRAPFPATRRCLRRGQLRQEGGPVRPAPDAGGGRESGCWAPAPDFPPLPSLPRLWAALSEAALANSGCPPAGPGGVCPWAGRPTCRAGPGGGSALNQP